MRILTSRGRAVVLIAILLPVTALPVAAQASQISAERLERAGRVVDAIGLRFFQEPVRWPTQPDSGRDGFRKFAERAAHFADAYMTMERIRPVAARAYAERFDDEELAALVAFYSSPVGKRLIRASQELDIVRRNILLQILTEHVDELDFNRL